MFTNSIHSTSNKYLREAVEYIWDARMNKGIITIKDGERKKKRSSGGEITTW